MQIKYLFNLFLESTIKYFLYYHLKLFGKLRGFNCLSDRNYIILKKKIKVIG